MLGNLTGWHLLIIVAIVLLLFGATRLPALARSIGQSTKIFREEMKTSAPPAETPATSESVAAPIAEPAAPTKSAKPGKSGKSAKP